ncbi:hypothetical protein [Streptomyces naganishii]|uniref:Uncharacterized protein n=1 Tax=Streptomyces naganishii JCM 4654 TaxID=1306179 RepID=A0A918YAS2_9ACTN|nr:hypothetical protein [Streptomyces naganishii]GHD97214.1 hypothetical protein GCM10010508_68930 [Streptomyces naganishii JCM 4654]
MTAKDTGTREITGDIRVRTEGDVDAEALAYVREKVGAALGRPGLPPASGEVRVARATAHHMGLLWSAGTEIRVGDDLVVVHAQEASAHELADRLQDRLRAATERAAHRGDTARRSATPPPWRGGPER